MFLCFYFNNLFIFIFFLPGNVKMLIENHLNFSRGQVLDYPSLILSAIMERFVELPKIGKQNESRVLLLFCRDEYNYPISKLPIGVNLLVIYIIHC